MARSNISDEQWDRAREYFEHGLSLKEISDKTGITKGAISKKANANEWDKESPKKLLLSQAVEVSKAKETLKKHPVSIEVHEELHDERVRRERLIYGNAELMASKISIMAEQIDTPSDMKTLAEANDKLAITLKVAERHSNSNVTVNTQNNLSHESKVLTIDDIYQD